MTANSFRFYFIGCLTQLFTFPSRYLFTIALLSYLVLEDGSPRFPQGMCPVVLRILLEPDLVLCTRFSRPLISHSRLFHYQIRDLTLESCNPSHHRSDVKFRLFRFRSPLLTESHMPKACILDLFSSPYLDVSVRVVSTLKVIHQLALTFWPQGDQ